MNDRKAVNNMFQLSNIFNTNKTYKPETAAKPADELQRQLTELCEQNFEIYVDTCSLLDPNGLKFLEAVENVIPKFPGKTLNVFVSVLNEVERVGLKEFNKYRTSNLILEKLRQLEASDIVKVVIGKNSHFSDVNFLSEFTLQSGETNVFLVTQDKALAEKVNSLPEFLGNVVHNKHLCEAKKLNSKGILEPFMTMNRNFIKEDLYNERKICFRPLYE